jgi:hypothetical protein
MLKAAAMVACNPTISHNVFFQFGAAGVALTVTPLTFSTANGNFPSPTAKLVRMKNEATLGNIVVGGQPDAAELRSERFACVINVRNDDEAGNVTAELVRGSDLAYASVPFTADTLLREHIDRIREVVDRAKGPVLIH